ncbi:ABC transporter permease [Fusibacter ferrireducens]|uniref:ABC transporter permease n=1 Tax=Fusibacter ferrireducens TaxID=2785058 RepID=A0ABR9ZX12_9FIRM|nr:ABC transporter permease [Fusibacter ferrireducens]MBF4695015.1 ABC transporter permease [Fusibacter ferrireducens]
MKKEKQKLSRTQLKKLKMKRKVIIWGVIVSFVLIMSFMAPFFLPQDPLETNALMMRKPPSFEHPLGTDNLGRDVFSRLLAGARTSIFATIMLVIFSFIVGTTIGVVCGYYGGFLDDIVMRFTDILLSVPQLVLAIAVAGMLGGSLVNTLIAIGITSWTSYARLARSHAMRIRQLPFINACRLTGTSDATIIMSHVVPNLVGPMLVNATLEIGSTMLNIAGLSFLGLGVAPPTPEWGAMVSESRNYLQLAPWAVFSPAIAILVTVMLFNYFGESVCDLTNTKEA